MSTDRQAALLRAVLDGERITAHELAERAGVSVRTVYRDVGELTGEHVPIVGRAGDGYRIDRDVVVTSLALDLTGLRTLVEALDWTDKLQGRRYNRDALRETLRAQLHPALAAVVFEPVPALAEG